MDSCIFSSLAGKFVEHVRPKTSNGRIVLLIYDGYKSHLGIKILNVLQKGGLIVYCIPSHTIVLLQPSDVSLFGLFKACLRDEIHNAAMVREDPTFDQFDFLHMIKRACIKYILKPRIQFQAL